MQYVAAYMLLALGGKEAPSSDDIKGLLEKAGVEVNEEKLETFVKAVEGKDINELIAQGKEKMVTIQGAAGSGSGGAAAGGAAGGAAAEEAAEEEEEEEVDVGGGDLFGGDGGGY
ncbi:60S acidic ribosomal protein P2 [Hondaea fermentalgiana]|uniref:60S acidic ribosomal protein P2 n=1 Tax=Hondaea fermentalgiana TaxID=2315210 RepID=A0A2R5GRA8_9STRA|nr:60S acidic ribosomal protein P2 [Hondaea fermentalgiana]|eukprot:GBG30881.1 60S acidic ribosomal protein P2 [Hondaea fermentalgiana]